VAVPVWAWRFESSPAHSSMSFFDFDKYRDIHRVNISHTLKGVALSLVGLYVPVFLLVNEYSLSQVITFYIVVHAVGLFYTFLLLLPLIRRKSLISIFKFHYPIEIIYFLLLIALPFIHENWIWLIAAIGGISNMTYWVPLNMLLIRSADKKKMGSDLGVFFALPKIFGIAGPLISAFLIPLIGFVPVFVIAMVGLVLSYLPLLGMKGHDLVQSFDLRLGNIWSKLRERKFLFILEGFDNIVEESEWFWGIFAFILIGTLQAPGYIGALEALGGAAFMLVVGKKANKHPMPLIFTAAAGLILVWGLRFFIETPLPAYIISIAASFVMTLFLVPYFSVIYKAVKDRKEEEFLILREIPTILARMIVFASILLAIQDQRLFFAVPIIGITILLSLLILRRRYMKEITAPIV
jgi:hypothetical protein